MNLDAALKLLRDFSSCNLRIFRQFSGFPTSDSQESGGRYVVFVDARFADDPSFCELKNYLQASNLSITRFGTHLMVYRQN